MNRIQEVSAFLLKGIASLMQVYPAALAEVDSRLHKGTGKHWNELKAEDWIPISFYVDFLDAYAKASPTGEHALVTFGKRVYSTIKFAEGLPKEIDSVQKMIQYEGTAYLKYHRGEGVRPRKYPILKEGLVEVEVGKIPTSCRILEGVFAGALDWFKVVGKVEHIKCTKNGDASCLFRITWTPK